MGQVYIIPDRREMELSLALIREYDGAFEYNDFWSPQVLEDEKAQEEIMEEYAKYRTDFSKDTMHGAFLDVNVCSTDPLIREASVLRVRQSMEIAKRMGLRGVVFHTGLLAGFRVPDYFEQWKRNSAEFFKELLEEYPQQEIFMENMFDESPEPLAGLAELMKDTERFGICLDYAHGAVTDCPQSTWVKTLAPYIRHMHINDNDLNIDLHQPVGEGQIDWMKFHSLLKEHAVDSTVLVEVKGYEAQKKSLEYLKQHGIFPLGK